MHYQNKFNLVKAMNRTNGNDGSELHRLKPMQEGYDQDLFNRLYKLCKPVIKNLVRQIDARRYNVTPDIIQAQFEDKMLFVFNKYYGKVSEEHLKANILRSLSTYKVHLLKYAYNERAEFNQSLASLDDLFDDSKEYMDDTEETVFREELLDKVHQYMKEHLSDDAYMVWQVVTNPPPYVEERMLGPRVTNIVIAEFFDLPKTRSAVKWIGELREDIRYWMERAGEEIKFD